MAYRSSAPNTGSSATATGLRPSGVVSGDLLVAFVATSGTGQVPTISGWTLISRVDGASQDPAVGLFYRVAGASEPASWSWTLPSSTNWVVIVSAYSGINTSAPIHAQSASWPRSYGTSSSASITTTATSDLIQVACVPQQTGGYAWNAALAEREDEQGYYILAGLADRASAPAGSYSYTATSAGVEQYQRSFLVALALSSGGGGSPPGQVTGLSATAVSSSQINLSWSAVSGATSYKVERATSSGGPWTEIATGITATTFSSTGLSASTTYHYRVRATNANGDGTYSATANATTQASGGGGSPPAAPTSPAALALSASSIRVSWTASSGATGYTVERSPNGTSSWAAVVTGHTASPYTDNGLSPSTPYWYRVIAVNGAGASSPSSIVTATTQAPAPGVTYAASAGWRWIQAEWPLLHRHRTTTLSGMLAGGTTTLYLATSSNGSTWRYWAGPVTNSRILTEVASQAAAETAAVSLAAIGNRVDLPVMVEARYYRVFFRNSTHATTWREYYPRRLNQADDMEAEFIRAIHMSVGSVTADAIAVNALDGTTITGAIIRTAATGQRVELDAAGLRTYNSDGVVQVEATTATNGALLAGNGGGGTVRLDNSGITIAPLGNTVTPVGSYKFAIANHDYVGLGASEAGNLSLSINRGTSGLAANVLVQANTAGQGTSTVELSALYNTLVAGVRLRLAQNSLGGYISLAGGVVVGDDFNLTAQPLGQLTVRRGLNVGTATGSSEGQIRTSNSINAVTDGVWVEANPGQIRGRFVEAVNSLANNRLVMWPNESQNRLTSVNAPWTEYRPLLIDSNQVIMGVAGGTLSFFNSSIPGGAPRYNVVGSRGGNAALASLLNSLANLGLITNGTTA